MSPSCMLFELKYRWFQSWVNVLKTSLYDQQSHTATGIITKSEMECSFRITKMLLQYSGDMYLIIYVQVFEMVFKVTQRQYSNTLMPSKETQTESKTQLQRWLLYISPAACLHKMIEYPGCNLMVNCFFIDTLQNLITRSEGHRDL